MWCGPASPACDTTTARQLSPEPCPSLSACLGDTYSGPGCLRRRVQERVRGRGNSLICLLKSPPPTPRPNSDLSLAELSRFPTGLLSLPPHILPGGGRDTKGSLPGTHRTGPTPHSRAAQTRSGSGLVRAGDGGGRTSASASGSVYLRWKGRLTQQSLRQHHRHPRLPGRDGWE